MNTPALDPAAVLEQWIAAEAALRERIAAAASSDLPPLRMAAALDGLSLMRAMLSGELKFSGIGQTMDFILLDVDKGRAVFQGTPGPKHLNPMGGVHGGWYATLLDSALGCSVATTLPAGRAYTTAELSVNIVRAVVPGKVQRVRAIGQVLHAGRQLATAEAKLVGADGTLYAHGTTTCLVFEIPAARA